MTQKIFVDANSYLRDSFRLARQVLDSGWEPEELIALWRGGAPVGVCVHEFLQYHGVHLRHRVLKCFSYTGIRERNREVVLEDAEVIFGTIPGGARVLVVDDVLDTGNTALAVLGRLAECGVEARLATVYWKPGESQTGVVPDYHVHATGEWVVFPHELEGLTLEEITRKDAVIGELVRR